MNKTKNEQGFTLVEMLVVLFIIAVLILVTIPNVTKHFSSVDEKGCSAYLSMVQGQIQAYKVNKGAYPSGIGDLATEEYIKASKEEIDNNYLTCPDGTKLDYVALDGTVKIRTTLNTKDN